MLEEKMNETPEEVFFKYAYPCSSELLRRNTINEEQKYLLDFLFEKKKAPGKDLLEACFPNAIKRLKRFGGKDYWTVESIRRYFLVHHNQVIDNKEDSYADHCCTQQFRDLCKVYVGNILAKKGSAEGTIYTVDFGDKKDSVLGIYLPDAEIGDKISIHWRFAIEKV